MLPILCGIACAVLVILDVSGKLHPERTRSQVLLHLFSMSGALLPSPVQWVPGVGMLLCAMTWCYTMVRICTCVPVSRTGSTPKLAAKQQLTFLWFSLPFFLLMLVSGVVLLVYLLSVWWMFAVLVLLFGIIFLPAIIFGAVMLGYVTLLMCLPLLLYLIALLIPYVMGIVYGNRYLIACAPCLGWKKPWRIFLQVVMFLPCLRWVVTAITMEKMRNVS